MAFPSLQLFAAAKGDIFAVAFDGESVSLTLADVISSGPHSGTGHQSFSLLFRTSFPTIMPQAIYPLHNEMLGTLEIFIVGIAQDGDGVTYEAVFN